MLDSLVRVSRRVGRVADTDTADAYTSRTSPITSKANRIDRHLRASTDTIDRLSVTRASFAADVYTITLALDTYCGPTTQDVRTGYEYLAKGLALNPNASSAFRIGRGAYLREMRQTKTTSRTQRSDLRSESSRRSPIVRLIPEGSRRLRPFSSKRFHALLNSLFKVLFNFPSRYLFAIGLVVIFSFRRGLPSALGYTLK
jgi:hypothetical protein